MRTITFALLAWAALSSCRTAGDPASGLAPASPVLARVDGEPVYVASYRGWLADVYGLQGREEFLGLWLLEREARRLGISVSAEEINAAREALWATWIRERLEGDAAALDAELARHGHDRESFRRWFYWQKRRELLASRIVHQDRKIEEQALQRRFDQEFGPGGVRTQVRLLVLTRTHLSKQLAQKPNSRTLTAGELDVLLLEKAEALRARALAGENFEDLVRAESTDLAVRKNGGLCGDPEWRLRGEAFVRAVVDAPLHVVQSPVANSSGIDLFEVISRETTRFEDVREELLARMQGEPPSLDEITALDQRLRAASRIEPP